MTRRDAFDEKQVLSGRSSPCPQRSTVAASDRQVLPEKSSPYHLRSRGHINERQELSRRSSPYSLRNRLHISERQAIPGRSIPYITRCRMETRRQVEGTSTSRRNRFRPYKQRRVKKLTKEEFATEEEWRFVLEQYESRPSHRSARVEVLKGELHKSTHVFVRRDSVRRHLQALYDGLYHVINRSDKCYKVNIHGKPTSISIDRLKPAFTHNVDDTLHIEKSDTETKPNLRKTRSGRRVYFPDYFVSSR
ncbi:pol polyprotein [Trichonephila clavata]|uniref:Pol polyprotein n=1 Tax=Trichonephila clavata TaxID=2740835 RepID=A0A8X6LN45_TRICU|nr:pol polyprotein [Trichonephila clavata]